ncbi:DUF1549 domain-containing protein, partial [bacterium]|nr:DUF1549 domain-containing protein [bacterium]
MFLRKCQITDRMMRVLKKQISVSINVEVELTLAKTETLFSAKEQEGKDKPMRVKVTFWVFLIMFLITARGLEQHDGVANTQIPAHLYVMKANNRIDEMVLARLKKLGIQPSDECSDEVFLRRVYLDVIGTLPRAKEVWSFLSDRNPEKRRLVIDKLLEREEYSDYWSMKWCDLLRVKSEFPSNLWPNAVQAYHRWIKVSLKENMPYDLFARTLLVSSGSNFRDPPVNFYRIGSQHEPQK